MVVEISGSSVFRLLLTTVTLRVVGYPESAGINRHVVGAERALQERSSESILASSLAGDIVRCRLKRR
jgi:hypothetical protein